MKIVSPTHLHVHGLHHVPDVPLALPLTRHLLAEPLAHARLWQRRGGRHACNCSQVRVPTLTGIKSVMGRR